MWTIGEQERNGEQYSVYTGFLAALQDVIEGDLSDPTGAPGWRAAGTRVRVRPPVVFNAEMNIHVLPVAGAELSVVSDRVKSDTVAFLQTLRPGATLFIAQLIDRLMDYNQLQSVRLFHPAPNGGILLDDVSPPKHNYAVRTTTHRITVVPVREE